MDEAKALMNQQIEAHLRERGYSPQPWQNPLTPVDPVAAYQMARRLVQHQRFDHYVAVAPEGHVYGFFFEKFGARMLSVEVGYPPRDVKEIDDLRIVRGGRVLVLEDDVISGGTLRLVAEALLRHEPATLALYLGRAKSDQMLEKVPSAFAHVFLAEDCLDPAGRACYEEELRQAFLTGKQ